MLLITRTWKQLSDIVIEFLHFATIIVVWFIALIAEVFKAKKRQVNELDENTKIAYGTLGLFTLGAGSISVISYLNKRKQDQEE